MQQEGWQADCVQRQPVPVWALQLTMATVSIAAARSSGLQEVIQPDVVKSAESQPCSYRVQLQAQCSARWQKVSLFILHCNSFRPNNNKITELAVLISGMADSCSFSSSVLCITAIQQQLEVSYAETSISAVSRCKLTGTAPTGL